MKAIDKILMVLVVAFSFFGMGIADLCAKGSKMMEGNAYCQEVKSVKYMNVGKLGGVYDEVISMDSSGTCNTKPKHFSGFLSPFDEELSLHLRGPIAIKQFAAYTLQKFDQAKRDEFHHVHGHKSAHNAKKHRNAKKDMVIATIDGLVQSWENNWFGGGPDAINAPATTLVTGNKAAEPTTFGTTTTATITVSTTTCIVSEASPAKQADPNSAHSSAGPVSESKIESSNAKSKNAYSRTSYYDSVSQTADNVVFLGNHGGQGSGIFDLNFGASLSYVNCDGTSGSTTSQILADTVIPSGNEITIMTGEQCKKDDCGYYRPGSVGYRGFDGSDKIFFLEFGMPSDGNTGFEGDQPAVWLLNAKIPRTQQYGACSCWPSCGEIDIAECLSVGSHYMKSTVHADASGGDSDYFKRPVTGTTSIVTIFRKDEIYIGIVPNQKFPEKVTSKDIDKIIEDNAWSESVFNIT